MSDVEKEIKKNKTHKAVSARRQRLLRALITRERERESHRWELLNLAPMSWGAADGSALCHCGGGGSESLMSDLSNAFYCF